MSLIPLPYRILGGILLIASAFALGFYRGASSVRDEVRAAEARTEVIAAKLQAQEANQTVKVVTEYVDRVQTIEKHVPVVRDRLIRVCDQAHSVVPSGAGNPHAATQADPPDRDDHGGSADALAQDLIGCRENTEQLRALQAWKRAHGG